MELILADATGKELGLIPYDTDIEVGEDNTFEIGIPAPAWDGAYQKDMRVFIPGTEYGGLIGQMRSMANPEFVYICGRTWRGLLDKKIISPAAGEDYYTIGGELNECIRTLLRTFYQDTLIRGSTEDTGVNIAYFRFERYTTLMDGLTAMLATVNARPQIRYMQAGGYIEVAAVPIMNYSAQIELSTDAEITIDVDQIYNGVNHLICLGQGELSERTVVHLYTDETGRLVDTQVLTGREEIAEVYDYTGAETEEELRKYGTERLNEIKNRVILDAQTNTLRQELEIGDIISGRDFTTKIYVKKPIKGKIFKITNEIQTTEYRLEE